MDAAPKVLAEAPPPISMVVSFVVLVLVGAAAACWVSSRALETKLAMVDLIAVDVGVRNQNQG